ncbi:MAG: hypothetical protein ACOCT0_04540, partial [Halobacteriota archaeon]
IQTERLVDWWPTHVDNDEETQLDVRVYAEVGPSPLSKSITLYRHRDTVETDVVTGESRRLTEALTPEAGADGVAAGRPNAQDEGVASD